MERARFSGRHRNYRFAPTVVMRLARRGLQLGSGNKVNTTRDDGADTCHAGGLSLTRGKGYGSFGFIGPGHKGYPRCENAFDFC